MNSRPVLALILPPGPRLYRALQEALSGTGPALCPFSPQMPAFHRKELLTALAPAAVETISGQQPWVPAGSRVDPEVAVVLATSGSSGTPKFAELSASALRYSARAALDRLAAEPGERWLCCLPTSHISGLQILTRSILTHTKPDIVPRFDVAVVAASDAAFLSVAPTQLRRLVDAQVDMSRFRAVLVGGAALSQDLRTAAQAHGARIVTTYGATETCGGCVYDGTPLTGVRVQLSDSGRVLLAGPVLFRGYRNNPGLTAAAWDGNWFQTQDLGVLRDGQLHVLGRADNVINTGGEKIAADRVARVLALHPHVRDVVVVGRPDPEWGERIVAVVVPGNAPPSLTELRAWAQTYLPPAAAPRELELVSAIPLLASGKPDRAQLATPTASPGAAPSARHAVGPRGEDRSTETLTRWCTAERTTMVSELFDPREWKPVDGFEFTDVTYHRAIDQGTVRIAFNRPTVRNAFRPHTVDELCRALDHARQWREIGCVLLTGNGPSSKDGGWAFCSGGDQRVRGKHGYQYTDDGTSVAIAPDQAGRLHILEAQRLIRFMGKVVICLVPGWAAGGGHSLHVVCDLTIASREHAQFKQTDADVGSFDGGFGSAYLARQVGQKFAREIFFLGDTYTADDAHRMGMVNSVVPHAELETTALHWAAQINRKSPTAQRMLKFAFNLIDDGLVGQQVFAGEATRLAYGTDEAAEGCDAFLRKRSPDWSRFPWHY